MDNYNPDWVPNLTQEQASHLARLPYGSLPSGIQGQVNAMMQSAQERNYRMRESTLNNSTELLKD